MTNIFMVIAAILYIRSNKRTRELMVYAVIIGFGGEYLFSVGLNIYPIDWKTSLGTSLLDMPQFMQESICFLKHHHTSSREITQFLYLLISIVAFVYWIAFNDVFGLVMTLGVLLALCQGQTFFLTMYMVVAVLEIGGTAYSLGCGQTLPLEFFHYYLVTTHLVGLVCSTSYWTLAAL